MFHPSARQAYAAFVLLFSFQVLCSQLEGRSGFQVIPVGSEKQLFLDDSVLESMEAGVFLILNQPLKYAGNPLIEMDRCWEADMHFANSTNVIYDEEEKLFKIWTETVNYRWTKTVLAYYVSQDGLRWEKPSVGQFDYHSPACKGEPTRRHNFLMPGIHRAGVFKDSHETDPQKRYKMLYNPRAFPGKKESRKATWAAFSPDGIHWTDYPAEVNPVLLNNDTHQVVFWDEQRRKYVAHIRLAPDIFRNDPRFSGGGRVRVPGIATSEDFLHWYAPKEKNAPVEVNQDFIAFAPDAQDAPATRGFYSLETLPYEGIYIGFPTPYHNYPDLDRQMPPSGGTARNPWIDTIDVQLAFSRDGLDWKRVGERRPFLPIGPEGSYDGGMVFVSQHPVVRRDLGEIWVYYVGFRKGHVAESRGENEESTINLARLRLDGFVSLTAGQGSATTRTLTFAGTQLAINAATAGDEGFVGVEILEGRTGQPLPGYGREDFDAFRGDSVRHTVTWKGRADVSSLAAKPVKLRFHLQRSKLFSFQFFE